MRLELRLPLLRLRSNSGQSSKGSYSTTLNPNVQSCGDGSRKAGQVVESGRSETLSASS